MVIGGKFSMLGTCIGIKVEKPSKDVSSLPFVMPEY